MRTCDWCEAAATHHDTRGDGLACDAHHRELKRDVEARVWRAGNPFAGEAAEALVRPLGER